MKLKVKEYIRTAFGEVEKVTCTKIENTKKNTKKGVANEKERINSRRERGDKASKKRIDRL